jgi:alkylation response protein AidB-like acyl-CoA dehydrogenase
MDRLRPVARVELDGVAVPWGAVLPDRDGGVRRVLDRALVMIAAEMVGGAEACLDSSVGYAKQRVQFGKPIGVHQAIKHKCADMLFGVESARSIACYAAWAARERAPDAAVAAAMAKATACDAFRRAAQDNLQIHGGVGFTWEYDCHLYLKRAKTDEAWLGDAEAQRRRIALLLGI